MTVISFFSDRESRVQLYFLTFEWENFAIFRFTFELYGNSLDRFFGNDFTVPLSPLSFCTVITHKKAIKKAIK